MNDDLWQPMQYFQPLHNDEVHLWRACTDQSAPVFHLLAQTLSNDERARSERYYFERDRKRYIVGRGILRMILSSYLQTNPRSIKFRYSSYGKPILDGTRAIKNLDFNVSHSAGLAIYAVVRNKSIGIDLEKIQPILEAEQITKNLFSHDESEIFHWLPKQAKTEAFINCWTRKEAYLKARGRGLSLALDQITVSFMPGEPARLLRVENDLQETTRWSISAFSPASGYAAALAVQGYGLGINYYSWGLG
jgi:4'-phosphopantetheinyl transferase